MAAKVYEVIVNAHDGSDQYVTVLGYSGQLADVVTAAGTPESLAKSFSGTATDGLRATLRTSGFLDSVTAREVLPPGDTGVPTEYTHALTLAGTYSAPGFGDDVPQELCGLVRKHTDAAVRGAHGWTFGYPLRKSGEMTGETLTAGVAYWTGLLSLATGLAANIIDPGTFGVDNVTYTPALISRARHARHEANWWFGITSCVASNRVHYIRRRGR